MTKIIAMPLMFLFIVASCLTTALPVKAESQTIVVPDQYPTITAALANAHTGDTIYVRNGTYNEHMLIINSTLSLIGEGAGTTIVNCQDSGYLGYWPHLYSSAPIQINADNVVVSGFSLLGGLEGIYGYGSGTQIIGNVIQQGITVQGSQEIIANNTINGVNKGPELGSFSAINIQIRGANNKVIGNQITSDGMAGVDVFGSNSIVYGNSIFAGPNAIGGIPGVQLEYNSSGITIAKNNLVNTSINIETATSFNVVCGNTIGGAISFMGFNNSFYGNTLTWRVFIGGTHGGSVDAAKNLFCNNNFMVNSPEVEVFTGSPGTEFWDNGAVGNYWSNYAGQDSDNKGIGDQLYLVTTSYSTTGYTSGNIGYDHYPLMLPFDTSSITVSAPQWITPVFNPPTYNPKPTDTPSSTPQNTLLPQPSPSTTNSPIPSVSLKPNPPGNSSQPSVLAELLPVVVFAVLVGLIFAIIVFLKKQRSR